MSKEGDLGHVTVTRCSEGERTYYIASVRVGPKGEFGSVEVVPGDFGSEEEARLAAQDLYRSRVALIGEGVPENPSARVSRGAVLDHLRRAVGHAREMNPTALDALLQDALYHLERVRKEAVGQTVTYVDPEGNYRTAVIRHIWRQPQGPPLLNLELLPLEPERVSSIPARESVREARGNYYLGSELALRAGG